MSEPFLQLPALSPSQATPQETQLDPFSFTSPVPFLATTATTTTTTVPTTPVVEAQPPKSLPQLLIKHAYKQPKHSTLQGPKSANSSSSSSLYAFRRSSSFKQQQQQQQSPYTLPAALQARIMHFQKQKEMLQYQQQQQQVQRQHPYELSIEIATAATTTTAAAGATTPCPKSAPVTTACTPRARYYSLPDTHAMDPAFALLCSFSFDDAVEKTTSPSCSGATGVVQEREESFDQMRMQMSFIRGYINQL
ncbi:hypothetical protein HDU78_010892 [Chytriomyces hyalinus]|nr:hypothetical protein HDU78_010892 [Chytriomyces hyalinus]